MRSPLEAPVLPRRLAPVLPTPYSPRYLLLAKAHAEHEHLEFPYHTCVHCKGFAAAAPRRARTSISVSFWGLPLSWPLRIFGLVGRYPANYLIRRRPIVKCRSFEERHIPVVIPYPVLPSLSQGYPGLYGTLSTCYSAVCCGFLHELACLNRIPIAAIPRRINGYYILITGRKTYFKLAFRILHHAQACA